MLYEGEEERGGGESRGVRGERERISVFVYTAFIWEF